ncbi:MAG: hypothetical protein WBS20_15585, partial [Lysobacterales bacterium]
LALFAQSAWSYLDPGTGSMLLQVILGGFAAIGLVLKLFWHRIRIALSFSKKVEDQEQVKDK